MDKKESILVVDGNSLAMRSIFGYGTTEKAISGFFYMLDTVTRAVNPSGGLLLAFDGKNNIRRATFPFYKSTRPPTDPEVASLLNKIKETVSQRNINATSFVGWEADDVVASVSAKAANIGIFCYIGTSDRDAYANISNNTTVVNFQNGVRDLKFIDPEVLFEKYGIKGAPLNQYLDYASLRGDPSDNISGVVGIGEVTAKKLLQLMPSIQEFYAYPDKFKTNISQAVYKKLIDGKDIFYRNLNVMTPNTSLSVSLNFYTNTARLQLARLY